MRICVPGNAEHDSPYKEGKGLSIPCMNSLILSSSPHIHSKVTVEKIMWGVVISLVPAVIGSIYFFGQRVITILGISIGTSILAEALINLLKCEELTIRNGSAFLTGVLLAFNLPPAAPLWLPAVGAVFSIAIVKQAFGGLGCNIFNPALAGRAFLMAAWPSRMTTGWIFPCGAAISGATPLTILKESRGLGTSLAHSLPGLKELFLGNVGGCIGETSALLLLIGAIFLFLKRYITWHIPFTFIGTVVLFTLIAEKSIPNGFIFHMLSGGLFLGAFFMATDYVTSPISPKGKLIFGTGCGIITCVIRLYGGYPEGVSYSILLMNAATPLIDRYTRLKVFGGRKHG